MTSNGRNPDIHNFDLGIGGPITPGPIDKETEGLLEKNPIHWQVYPIETVIAEKIHALVDRGADNSRSKDIFDLHLFFPKDGQALRQQSRARRRAKRRLRISFAT